MPNIEDLRHILHFTLIFNVIVVWFDFCPEDPLLYFSLHGEVPINWEFENLLNAVAAAAKLLQSCPTLRDPIDSSPPGSPVPGSHQARTLEWVAISFSNAWKWSCSVMSNSSWPHGLQPTRLLRPWDFPGKSTGVGCHCLLHLLNELCVTVTGII